MMIGNFMLAQLVMALLSNSFVGPVSITRVVPTGRMGYQAFSKGVAFFFFNYWVGAKMMSFFD